VRGVRSGGPSWSLVLILVSTAATAAAAVQAWRLARSHQETSERVLRDHAGVATWNYSRYATAALTEAVVSVLGPVMHFQMHGQRHRGPPPTGQWFVNNYLDETSPFFGRSDAGIPEYLPRTFMSFTLGADTIAVFGDAVPAEQMQGLTDTLNLHIRAHYQPTWGFGLLTRQVNDRPLTVAWTVMPTESALDQVPGDTAIYLFVVKPSLWLPLLQETYERAPILPPQLTQELSNEAVLAVSLRNSFGEKLFRSHAEFSGPVVEQELSPQFGGLRVSAAVVPQMAETLIIGGLPRSRVPYLLGLLMLSALLSLVAIRQLRREQELARVRADFVSSVSHELRTPLAQIRLFLETLRLGRVTAPDQIEWSLANIDRETARLSTMVERILTFSRASRDELALSFQPLDVGEETREIVDSFAPLASARRTNIVLQTEANTLANLDRDAYRQMILNLLDNAIKYGSPGQTVDVRVARSNGFVRTTVTDQGPGIARDERDEIFRPFHRGREGARSGSGGGGIGLSIVRTLAEQHGGAVHVENARAGGAKFAVDIPGLESKPSPATPPRVESPEQAAAH
jgi:signal transduction histidine kinase